MLRGIKKGGKGRSYRDEVGQDGRMEEEEGEDTNVGDDDGDEKGVVYLTLFAPLFFRLLHFCPTASFFFRCCHVDSKLACTRLVQSFFKSLCTAKMRSPSSVTVSSCAPRMPSKPCRLRPLASTIYISRPSPTWRDEISTGAVPENENSRTSMWRSVAPVNESMTMERTVGRGKCCGCDVPDAGCWFLK